MPGPIQARKSLTAAGIALTRFGKTPAANGRQPQCAIPTDVPLVSASMTEKQSAVSTEIAKFGSHVHKASATGTVPRHLPRASTTVAP